MKLATDHFHHYTYGDTDEPDVSAQLKPINEEISVLYETVRALRETVLTLKRRLDAQDGGKP
jgi:hypothetical protein